MMGVQWLSSIGFLTWFSSVATSRIFDDDCDAVVDRSYCGRLLHELPGIVDDFSWYVITHTNYTLIH